MKHHPTYFALALLLCASSAHAQFFHAGTGVRPQTFAAPLTFVRFVLPDGVEPTFFQGRIKPRSFTAPVTVGMRPGYLYRVRLENIPGRNSLALYPTIEVRGSLKLPPKFAARNFPATVRLTQEDLDAAFTGSLITKVIYLEHPDKADPRASSVDDILETQVTREVDPFNEARRKGRIILVVHLGERTPTHEELAQASIPGTILFPDEKVVGPAACPPIIPNGLMRPFYDPHHGPQPLEEECLHDGGDRHVKAGFDIEGNLTGLDPEDTIAEYRDAAGVRRLNCSNRVCLCVPRFVAIRKECPLAITEGQIGPDARRMIQREGKIHVREGPELTEQKKRLHGFDGRLRPSVNVAMKIPETILGLKVLQASQITLGAIEKVGTKELRQLTLEQRTQLATQIKFVIDYSQVIQLQGTEQIKGLSIAARVFNGPEVYTTSVSVRDLTVCCNEEPQAPEKPLCLFKCADRGSAKPGDIVVFSLRYSNNGGKMMTDVAITDSLSGRLEYVEGSAESDRDAVFTTQENEVGSQVLRWEISGKLLPGQTGRLRFKAKVR